MSRLADDHRRARRLAEGLARIPGLTIDLATVQTNIVRFDVGGLGYTTGSFAEALRRRGVSVSGGAAPGGVRMVVHRHIDDEAVDEALAAASEAALLIRKLVLASASPRRQALVGLLELAWRAAPADVDEARYLLADPFVGALNVALAKARAVEASEAEVIVAADTLVVADGESLGKPGDADTARAMLRQLRGRPHLVLTGVALRTQHQQRWGGVVSTRVIMRDYADREIEDYIGRGEPFDKAWRLCDSGQRLSTRRGPGRVLPQRGGDAAVRSRGWAGNAGIQRQ